MHRKGALRILKSVLSLSSLCALLFTETQITTLHNRGEQKSMLAHLVLTPRIKLEEIVEIFLPRSDV